MPRATKPTPMPPMPPSAYELAWDAAISDVRRKYSDIAHSLGLDFRSLSVRELHGLNLRLPPFQRPGGLWSAHQQAQLVRDVMRDRPVPLLVFYYDAASSGTFVLDGQQRLGALGVPVSRHDGAMNPTSSAVFDTVSLDFVANVTARPNALRIEDMEIGATRRYRRDVDHDDAKAGRRDALALQVGDMLAARKLPAVVLHSWRMSVEDVARVFVQINTPGVPLTAQDAKSLVASCADWGHRG